MTIAPSAGSRWRPRASGAPRPPPLSPHPDSAGRAGEPIESEAYDVGFRAVEIRGGLLRVNGQPLLIRGANRHEHDAASGHVVTPAAIEQDLLLMKRHNFNAVRCSHYPNHPELYRLCDRLGLYVVDEANLETHGMTPMGRLARDPAWSNAFLERVTRMVARDFNHPSIIIWSLATSQATARPTMPCMAGSSSRIRAVRCNTKGWGRYAGHRHHLPHVCPHPPGSAFRRCPSGRWPSGSACRGDPPAAPV